MPATGRGGSGRVGRGGVGGSGGGGRGGGGDKPCERPAQTGPVPPNRHLISCTLRRAGTQKEQRQQSRRSPLGPDKINLQRWGPHTSSSFPALHPLPCRRCAAVRAYRLPSWWEDGRASRVRRSEERRVGKECRS